MNLLTLINGRISEGINIETRAYAHGLLTIVDNYGIYVGFNRNVNAGRVTFNPTINGNAAGQRIFQTIRHVNAKATANITNPQDAVLCSLNNITGGNQSVTINVVRGRVIVTLLLGAGATLEFAPNGTSVSCEIIGIIDPAIL